MNVERLRALVKVILKAEAKSKVNSNFQPLVNAYSSFQQNPANPNIQQQVAAARDKFNAAAADLVKLLDTAEGHEAVFTLRIERFTTSFAEEVDEIVKQNANLPSVLTQRLSNLANERNNAFSKLTILDEELTALGGEDDAPAPGEAQLGTLLPRQLFDNSPEGLADQLNRLDKIFKAYSELVTGSAESAKVGSMSTTDPLIFFHLNLETVQAVVHGVKIAIEAINTFVNFKRSIESLKGMLGGDKAEELKLEVLSNQGEYIRKEVALQVSSYHADIDHKNELITKLSYAVSMLVEQIEGGMIVQLRLNADDAAGSKEDGAKLRQLLTEVRSLQFPNLPAEGKALIENKSTR